MNTINTVTACYEVHNPSFGDMNLQVQISRGCNDWVAIDQFDLEYFGETKQKAIDNCLSFGHR